MCHGVGPIPVPRTLARPLVNIIIIIIIIIIIKEVFQKSGYFS